MKSKQLLDEFVIFCQEQPELTFWQALLAWIQKKHDSQFFGIYVYKNKHLYDTRNWTGEDHPMFLFKDDVTINVINKE